MPSWQDELHKYITGIIQNQGNKVFAIGGVPDHLHIFMDISPTSSLSDLMRDVKASATKWINKKNFNDEHFQWQRGFAAFSYAKSQLHAVATYVENQEEHHKKKSFHKEIIQFLDRFEVSYEERYLFKDLGS
jgi:REP element-mobilizing transposase RayT